MTVDTDTTDLVAVVDSGKEDVGTLIKVGENDLTVAALFASKETIDLLVGQIEEKVRKHVPDLTTACGRGDIKSLAYAVAQSKVILDTLGKGYVAELKAKPKKVDELRKSIRDRLDALRNEARKPLTDWEEEQARIQEQERLAAEYDAAWDEAHVDNQHIDEERYDSAWDAAHMENQQCILADREKAVREKEVELARQEAERKAKEEAERAELERKEREARIAKEAEERAKREAEEKVQQAQEAAKRAEQERIEAEARAKAEKEAAVAEAERKAKEEAERKERERLAAEKKANEEAERIAKNKQHRKRVEREARESFELLDFTPEQATLIVEKIAAGQINHVSISY